MLLRLEAIHVHGQLGRSHNVRKIDKFPAYELGTITEIEILAQCIILPASGLLDVVKSPESGCSIDIEKTAAAAASGLLQQKVSVQKDGLHARVQRITAIQLPPWG